MQEFILSPIPKDELIKELLIGVQTLLDKNREHSINEKENWTIKETAEYCKVSKVTIYQWTKKGILKKYKIGNRVFYKKNEVVAAVIKIED